MPRAVPSQLGGEVLPCGPIDVRSDGFYGSSAPPPQLQPLPLHARRPVLTASVINARPRMQAPREPLPSDPFSGIPTPLEERRSHTHGRDMQLRTLSGDSYVKTTFKHEVGMAQNRRKIVGSSVLQSPIRMDQTGRHTTRHSVIHFSDGSSEITVERIN